MFRQLLFSINSLISQTKLVPELQIFRHPFHMYPFVDKVAFLQRIAFRPRNLGKRIKNRGSGSCMNGSRASSRIT